MIGLSGAKLAIYAGIVAAILAIGFAGGHRWQAGEVADAEKAQAAAETDRDLWKRAADGYKRATEGWQATLAANEKAEAKQQAQAKAALEQLAREEEAARKDAAAWERRFKAAQRDPDCAELMEATTCPAFSDY